MQKILCPYTRTEDDYKLRGTTSDSDISHKISLPVCSHTPAQYRAPPSLPTVPAAVQDRSSGMYSVQLCLCPFTRQALSEKQILSYFFPSSLLNHIQLTTQKVYQNYPVKSTRPALQDRKSHLSALLRVKLTGRKIPPGYGRVKFHPVAGGSRYYTRIIGL